MVALADGEALRLRVPMRYVAYGNIEWELASPLAFIRTQKYPAYRCDEEGNASEVQRSQS